MLKDESSEEKVIIIGLHLSWDPPETSACVMKIMMTYTAKATGVGGWGGWRRVSISLQ